MGLRALVVDDNAAFCEAVAETLEARNLEVHRAYDFEVGKQLSDSYSFDLAVIDVVLPDRSGWELLTYVRDKHPSMSCVVISAEVPYGQLKEMGRARKVAVLSGSDLRPEELDRCVKAMIFEAVEGRLGSTPTPKGLNEGLREAAEALSAHVLGPAVTRVNRSPRFLAFKSGRPRAVGLAVVYGGFGLIALAGLIAAGLSLSNGLLHGVWSWGGNCLAGC